MKTLRIAALASNNGSSFRAIAEAIVADKLDATISLLVSNRLNAPALDYARARGIPALCIPTKGAESEADEKLYAALVEAGVELVNLSGYLRRLGPKTLAAFEGRILNVHPALLPKYGGAGMYGRKVHQAVLDARELVTGATIHLVDAEYDHGRIIASTEVGIESSDDVVAIECRVMQAECDLFVQTVQRIAAGELSLPL
ncbi:phosphoribosylglycinamide formyltransferase [Rhizobium sp. ICMP 5592]|uniref:phosphoribosylglycinamide formyltransferase n=1 Tax=Rhizobium sp. ICMP 5592 TaxID=2292445 RepID=UPI001296AFC3|nr:phosphoribosylglycinamide formyltransferase [Rhizobium sp. ICMP 5592]MQB41972.1 phosphoribosylglycinamide formyltransferase [Rhizobium sp. ICMP 5592]